MPKATILLIILCLALAVHYVSQKDPPEKRDGNQTIRKNILTVLWLMVPV